MEKETAYGMYIKCLTKHWQPGGGGVTVLDLDTLRNALDGDRSIEILLVAVSGPPARRAGDIQDRPDIRFKDFFSDFVWCSLHNVSTLSINDTLHTVSLSELDR